MPSSKLWFACVLAVQAPVLAAQDLKGLTWTEQKCVLYRDAVDSALDALGKDGVREDFMKANDNFIAGGCAEQGNVCPVTDKEFELANLLTVMTMNEGMASTFVPFGCRD